MTCPPPDRSCAFLRSCVCPLAPPPTLVSHLVVGSQSTHQHCHHRDCDTLLCPPRGTRVCGCSCPGGRIDFDITTGDVVRGYTAAPRNSLSFEPLLLGRLASPPRRRVLAPRRASDTRTVTSGHHLISPEMPVPLCSPRLARTINPHQGDVAEAPGRAFHEQIAASILLTPARRPVRPCRAPINLGLGS